MNKGVEVSPFIDTNLSIKAKEELYSIPFSYERIANKLGEKPIKNFGFLESEEGYNQRLKKWLKEDDHVLFYGWICKDMLHYQEIRNIENTIVITFEFNEYVVKYGKKEYVFPVHPDTIDDFINDMKRIGVKLHWNEKIVDIYGIENISSHKKVVDYHQILKDLKSNNGPSS
jgi:hypothetical protein